MQYFNPLNYLRKFERAEEEFEKIEESLFGLIDNIIDKRINRRNQLIKPLFHHFEGENKETDSNGDVVCFLVNLKINNKNIPLLYSYDKYFITQCAVALKNIIEDDLDDEKYDVIENFEIKRLKEKDIQQINDYSKLSLKNFYTK